jgi:hypothetical protein
MELNFSAASVWRSYRRLAEQARCSPVHVLLLNLRDNHSYAHGGGPDISADAHLQSSNDMRSAVDQSRQHLEHGNYPEDGKATLTNNCCIQAGLSETRSGRVHRLQQKTNLEATESNVVKD